MGHVFMLCHSARNSVANSTAKGHTFREILRKHRSKPSSCFDGTLVFRTKDNSSLLGDQVSVCWPCLT